MRILFGPEHDARHVAPDTPGAYEWWYFDALSDDGRWALVVIYFLGSPMSPYYKAVVDGKNPDPRDWCGVFVSMHERVPNFGWWNERAYAYNLYRGGDFSETRPAVAVGGSRMESEDAGDGRVAWRLSVDERGLWRGRTRADLTFTTPGPPLAAPPLGDKGDPADHSWVCVAPVCRAAGTVTLPNGEEVVFSGDGYHDHNFGRLPWSDTEMWTWGRAPLRCDDGARRSVVLYETLPSPGQDRAHRVGFAAVFDAAGRLTNAPETTPWEVSLSVTPPPFGWRYGFCYAAASSSAGRYGLRYRPEMHWRSRDRATGGVLRLEHEKGVWADGPFYRRAPMTVRVRAEERGSVLWTGTGEGVGEVFQPARLCGPIASRAMWSRIRRR